MPLKRRNHRKNSAGSWSVNFLVYGRQSGNTYAHRLLPKDLLPNSKEHGPQWCLDQIQSQVTLGTSCGGEDWMHQETLSGKVWRATEYLWVRQAGQSRSFLPSPLPSLIVTTSPFNSFTPITTHQCPHSRMEGGNCLVSELVWKSHCANNVQWLFAVVICATKTPSASKK